MMRPTVVQEMIAPSLEDIGLVIPEVILIGAALVLMLVARRIRSGQTAFLFTVVAGLAAAVVAAGDLGADAKSGFAGMLALDGYASFFKVLVAATLILASMLAAGRRDGEGVPRGEYHVLLILAATGMMLTVASTDLIPLYLGLELLTICAYILVGIRVERPSTNEAAIKYFLLGSFASALLLFGIALTYGLAGTTAYDGIAAALVEHGLGGHPLLLVSLGLIGSGLAFKIAAVPFHSWAPDAYEGAGAPVAGFLAAGSKAAGLAAIGRMFLIAFGSQSAALMWLLLGLAALSIVVGSLLALSQTDMKRLLAYSSIAHAGYAILGILAGTPEGVSATMTYAFFYVFMTLGTFGVVVAMGERGERVDGFQGLAAQRPLVAALMLFFLLSLTGIPPTAGFAAKFTVISSAVAADQVGLAVLAVACSVVTAFVYMRVAVLMYMKEPEAPALGRLPFSVTAALAVAAFITLIGGIVPGSFANWAVAP